MKQVVQDVRTGSLQVIDIPEPALRPGGGLVQTAYSLVSLGTERQTISLARKSLFGKALSRPDLVRQVLEKARAEGVGEAVRQARARLGRPIPLGYSSSGLVVGVGAGLEGLRVGDQVACSGLGFASHAELVFVPGNMLAPVPESVDLKEAAFAGVGAIALHGIRTGGVDLGSRVVVIGLGLLGLIAVQILKAAGCHVFGTDVVAEKVRLAVDLGAEGGVPTEQDVAGAVRAFTRGHGADAVLITASAPSTAPLVLAAEVARERARIVALGMVRLDVPRRIFYEKELQLIVPRSSGPGAHDARYETRGVDYPIAYARWTHRRNLEEFLALVQARRVDLQRLITHRASIAEAESAYATIMADPSVIGLLLAYPAENPKRAPIVLTASPPAAATREIGVGMIGAGLFGAGTLLPEFRRVRGIRLRGLATATGVNARVQGERFGFEYVCTEPAQVLGDPHIDAVIIATRHDLHARLVADALARGKAVFVEKPLAVSPADLEVVLSAWRETPGRLMVGFNRRFAPSAKEAARWLRARSGPTVVHCRVNVGGLDPQAWLLDREEGGGVIVGEAGHFIDLLQFLCGSSPAIVHAAALPGDGPPTDFIATIAFADGSLGSLLYTVQGDRTLGRERIEAFRGGVACVIDNFRSLVVADGGRSRVTRRMGVDRGHGGELEAFFSAVRHGTAMPVSLADYVSTTLATFAIADSVREGTPQRLQRVE